MSARIAASDWLFELPAASYDGLKRGFMPYVCGI